MEDIAVAEVSFSAAGDDLIRIRREVFIEEQGVSEDEEIDGMDESSTHFIASTDTGEPIGTARLMANGQIGRMAVLKGFRGKGIGLMLLDAAIESARRQGHQKVFLHAQIQVVEFYSRRNFIAYGSTFLDAGIEHRAMELTL